MPVTTSLRKVARQSNVSIFTAAKKWLKQGLFGFAVVNMDTLQQTNANRVLVASYNNLPILLIVTEVATIRMEHERQGWIVFNLVQVAKIEN